MYLYAFAYTVMHESQINHSPKQFELTEWWIQTQTQIPKTNQFDSANNNNPINLMNLAIE